MSDTRDRDAIRAVFFTAWRKHRAGEPTAGIERLIIEVALLHPQYHAMLDDKGDTDRNFAAADDAVNPFLHMGMHITLLEQLAIDQPRGVAACYQRVRARAADDHQAQHRMLECLGEWIWRAQRDGVPPSPDAYLDCLRRLD